MPEFLINPTVKLHAKTKLSQMKSIAILIFSFLAAMASFSQQTPQKFITQGGEEFQYLFFVPEHYDGKSKMPLIFFLHGAGERGDDVDAVAFHGPPKFVKSNPDFPAIIVSPQCRKTEWWSNDKYIAMLNELYDFIVEKYNVDKQTVVLTGLSMGGFGTWKWAAENPKKFKTIVPICGGGEPEYASNYRNHRIWVFHGAKDAVVPPEKSDEMVAAIRKKGIDVQYTLYPEATHDSWSATYSNTDVLEWMLSPHYGKDLKINLK